LSIDIVCRHATTFISLINNVGAVI
jgi:hypothetical protein